MITNEERTLINQACEKYIENPSYLPSEKELMAIISWRACEAMTQAFYAMKPEDEPRGIITSTLNAQNKYVQKQIRRNELQLEKAQRAGEIEFQIVLERCGLHKEVASSVVLHCLTELLNDRFDRDMLGYKEGELTVYQQAEELGLTIIDIDCQRRHVSTVGTVVGLDHRALLIQFCATRAIVLLFARGELAYGLTRPMGGDMVRVEFDKGVLTSMTVKAWEWRAVAGHKE